MVRRARRRRLRVRDGWPSNRRNMIFADIIVSGGLKGSADSGRAASAGRTACVTPTHRRATEKRTRIEKVLQEFGRRLYKWGCRALPPSGGRMTSPAPFDEFLTRIRAGDEAAAADLVRRFEPLIR